MFVREGFNEKLTLLTVPTREKDERKSNNGS